MTPLPGSFRVYRLHAETALHTTEFLCSLVEVAIGWLLLRQAEVAHARLDGDATGAAAEFHTGKVASTRWFARTLRPKAALRRRLAEAEDSWVTELPETAV